MVRTAGCSALVRVGFERQEHPEVVISGAFSFDYFSLGEQRKVIVVYLRCDWLRLSLGEIPKSIQLRLDREASRMNIV
jgi:hypothetical protein